MSLIATLKSLFGLSPKSLKLEAGDRMLVCEDCGQQFVFDAGEQQFFKDKGFTDPKRCPRCRKKVRSRMRHRGRHHGGQRNNASNTQNNNRHNGHGRRHHHHNSVIDGDSPYADER